MSRNENEVVVPSVDNLKARIARLEGVNQSFAMKIADLQSQVKNLQARMDREEGATRLEHKLQ